MSKINIRVIDLDNPAEALNERIRIAWKAILEHPKYSKLRKV